MSRPGVPHIRIGAGPAPAAAVLAFVLLASIVVAGCASTVPTLWPFSSRTSDMSNGIRSGFAGTDTLLQLAETPAADIARFRSIRSYTASTLSAVVEYSRALAELAGAGREGKEAARETAEALGGLVAVAGAPEAAGVTTVAAAELAGAVAAVRARASLVEAVRTAQPAVDTIASILAATLSEMEDIVEGAAAEADRKAFADHHIMLDYHRSLTRDLRRIDEILTLFLDARAGSADALAALRKLDPDAPPTLKDSKEFDQRESFWRTRARDLDAELRRLEPEYTEYGTTAARISSSGAAAVATLRAGRTAVGAWARAHSRIPDALESGMQPSLVELSAAAKDIVDAARKGATP
jgi:hypothetical protein